MYFTDHHVRQRYFSLETNAQFYDIIIIITGLPDRITLTGNLSFLAAVTPIIAFRCYTTHYRLPA